MKTARCSSGKLPDLVRCSSFSISFFYFSHPIFGGSASACSIALKPFSNSLQDCCSFRCLKKFGFGFGLILLFLAIDVFCNCRCVCVYCFVALIPLSEFSDPHTMKKYGIKPDAETLDIVTTAAAQKEVIFLSLCFC